MEESVFTWRDYLLLGGPADGSWVNLPYPPPPYYLHREYPPVSVTEMVEVGDAAIGPIPATRTYNPVTLREGEAEYTVFVSGFPATRVIERLIYGYKLPKYQLENQNETHKSSKSVLLRTTILSSD